jgi:hypothetical protein
MVQMCLVYLLLEDGSRQSRKVCVLDALRILCLQANPTRAGQTTDNESEYTEYEGARPVAILILLSE